jgi:hypothetical protein
MKIMYAIAVVADLALAVLLVALSGFIFGGGPEGMHGELVRLSPGGPVSSPRWRRLFWAFCFCAAGDQG